MLRQTIAIALLLIVYSASSHVWPAADAPLHSAIVFVPIAIVVGLACGMIADYLTEQE